MKKIFTFIMIGLLLPFFAWTQVPRMLLSENFTSTTCGPCASQNPAYDALLAANQDIITSIKYHMSWPAPGNDPMYLHNTVDNNARRTYYGINSVPHLYMSGNLFHGMPAQVSQSMVENYAANNPSPFEILMQHRLSDDQDSVYVTMLIRADQAVNGNLVAQISVIEKHISFNSPPGTNGETQFHNVMKALIPSRNGTNLPDFEEEDYFIVEAAWELANVYDINEIAAVGFVQDNTSKHVHQAANSSTESLTPFYANDAAVKDISNATSMNCSGTMEPVIELVNYGSETLTSATIDFVVNGETVHSMDWSGSLDFLENTLVDAGEISFFLQDENTMEVVISSTNGNDDDYPKNNTMTYEFLQSPNVNGVDVSLFILLNNAPEETSWELLNQSGEVVQSGGPYTNPNSVVSMSLEVSDLGCYEFIMYDAGGDGLCCSQGTGYYAVLGEGSDPLFTGQSFGSVDRNQFAYGYVGQNELSDKTSVKVYPNPIENGSSVFFELNHSTEVTATLYTVTGKQLGQIDFGKLTAGTHVLDQLTSKLTNGLYILSLEFDGQNHIEKISIQ
jgi:hypothetical protein